MCTTCNKCVDFAIFPIMENTPKVELTISSLGGFTYSRFSKHFAIPSKQIKISCSQPMAVCNTLTRGVTITLILPL
jgi:hypothetical protein